MTGILPYYSVPRKNAAKGHDHPGVASLLADSTALDDMGVNLPDGSKIPLYIVVLGVQR